MVAHANNHRIGTTRRTIGIGRRVSIGAFHLSATIATGLQKRSSERDGIWNNSKEKKYWKYSAHWHWRA